MIFAACRGAAAKLPTAASQEDLATKACRGQPMHRPCPPSGWEATDGSAEASVSSRSETPNSCTQLKPLLSGVQDPGDDFFPPPGGKFYDYIGRAK